MVPRQPVALPASGHKWRKRPIRVGPQLVDGSAYIPKAGDQMAGRFSIYSRMIEIYGCNLWSSAWNQLDFYVCVFPLLSSMIAVARYG